MSAGSLQAPPPLRRPRRRRRRVSVVGVIGELLITAGVLVLFFLAWQLWISEFLMGGELTAEASQQSEEWNASAAPTDPPSDDPTDEPSDDPSDEPEPDPDSVAFNPPVTAAPSDQERFAALIVPRWGTDYYRQIAEGISTTGVLDRGLLGHYPTTQLPGQEGNFAIAAHRMGHGGLLHHIHELQLGDHIYVETAEGWYEYSFRNLEYVHPSGVGVIDPVPQDPAAAPSDRYITLTSCNPMYTSNERIIAYGIFDRFYPRDTSAPANGAPDEIAATVNGEA
ncbi:class E sortase [Homoserinibacter sp. GY 40078]|uniref:class E sortase n=1 Tax=Homoserinibacter sp. GY 40078 TaxID=2603275 RepID=UPI0011C75900|nr:class E sortase [Homoserinibacter sp. GY 40078]TXK18889.1 class E sortase [Homoserinibacter sp. GY 40078]